MGPWFHGGWSRSDGDTLGNVQFGSKTAEFYRDKIEFPFFKHYLKGKDDPKLPEAYVFETGTNSGAATTPGRRRTRRRRTLYFHADGKLSFDAPATPAPRFDEYISDPAKPVPYIGGHGDRHDPRVHGGRPALRLDAPDVLVVPDRRARRTTYDRRPDRPRRCSSPPPAPTPTGWSS